MAMKKLLTDEDRIILRITHRPSEKNPLLVDDIANRVYEHMMGVWSPFPPIVEAMEKRYAMACEGDDSCAFAEGGFRGLTSCYTIEPNANYPDFQFNPEGVAARAFVEGIARADDRDLVDHCVLMWDTDYQFGYGGRFPIMKRFLEGCDLASNFDGRNQEDRDSWQRHVSAQRKLVAVMQAANKISAGTFGDDLGLFYHVDGKVLMSSEKQGSLFDRPPRFLWEEYGR